MKRLGLSRLQIGLSVAAAAALLVVGTTTSQSGIFTTSSTTGACIPPFFAAQIIIDEFRFVFSPGVSSNEGVCRKVCEKTHTTCVHAVKRSRRCLWKVAKEGATVLATACKVEGESESECVDDAKRGRKDLRSFANADKDNAREFCSEFLSGCKSDCSNGD